MISVILPVYNRAKTIGAAIDSVLGQSFKDIELIVVDDCSTDDTSKIVKAYDDKRIKYVKLKKNSGACVARNEGVLNAKGEIVAFQDSDDQWEINKLEEQYKYLKMSGGDICFCKLKIYENGKFIKEAPRRLRDSCKVSHQNLLEGPAASTQAIIGKKECFLDIQFDPEMPRFQDWDLVLRLSNKYEVFYQNKALVRLNVQGDSISKNNSKGIAGLKKIYDKFEEEILSDNKAYANYLIMMGTLVNTKKGKYFAKAIRVCPSPYVIMRVLKNIL